MNSRLLLVAVLPLLLTICGAAKLNWSWLVPGGGLQLDRESLNSAKFCALTFDDGPDWKYTAEIGRILDRAGVHGTFFVLGKNVKQQPEVLSALVAGGHEIASHSWSHPDFTKAGSAKVKREFTDTNELLAGVGVTPRWFRPPYGAYNKATVRAAADNGLQTILWSVDPRDWATPGVEVIVNRVLEGVHPGAVILLHSTNPQTVAALPWILEGLQKKGYSMVTVTEWARLITGGAALPMTKDVPLIPPASPMPLPAETAATTGEPTALRVVSNFTGPRELDVVLRSGAMDKLYRFAYRASQHAPLLEEVQPPPAAEAELATAESVAAPTEAEPVPEPAIAELEAEPAQLALTALEPEPVVAAATEPPEQAGPTPLVASSEAVDPTEVPVGADWQFPAELDPALIDGTGASASLPAFLLVKSSGGSWSGSASINQLLTAGRFSGVLVAAEYNLTGQIANLAAPSLLYPMASLDPAAIVNLSRQNTAAILQLCAAGAPAIYLTIDTEQLTDYRRTSDNASIGFLAEFLLLRQATAGLRPSADANTLTGPLPEGVTTAAFQGGGSQVIALRGTSRVVELQLPQLDAPLFVSRLRGDGTVESFPAGATLTLGDELVILSSHPLAEH